MTRIQADLLIVIVGLLLEGVAIYGLTALGASERVIILGALICMILTCFAAGDGGIYNAPGKDERHR